jgi:hypothetical protein
MITLHIVQSSEYVDHPRCAYCSGHIDGDVIQMDTGITHQDLRLHRNCVVAFATRIQNEFEKL